MVFRVPVPRPTATLFWSVNACSTRWQCAQEILPLAESRSSWNSRTPTAAALGSSAKRLVGLLGAAGTGVKVDANRRSSAVQSVTCAKTSSRTMEDIIQAQSRSGPVPPNQRHRCRRGIPSSPPCANACQSSANGRVRLGSLRKGTACRGGGEACGHQHVP